MVVESILDGTKTVLDLTKNTLKDAENKSLDYGGTNYNLPLIYGLLGKKINNVNELKELINSLEIKYEQTLENALDNGIITLICAEALEALKYATIKEPYKPPYIGFIPDEILRSLGISLVNGKIPGILVIIGKVGNTEKLKKFIDDIRQRSILALFVGDIIKEMDEAGITYGIDKLLVPLGESITSAVHGTNLAIRVPLIYGRIEPGKTVEITDYIKNRVPAIVVALGELDNITLSAGAGCMKLGVPVITNNPVPEIKGTLESSDIEYIVENALKMKDVEYGDTMNMELPFDIGPQYEGERIRKDDMYIELGGPKVKAKAELAKLRMADEIEDGRIEVKGLDIGEMKGGGRYPFGIFVEVAGEKLEEDMEGVVERRIHEYCNFIEGFMHLNQRYDIWCRLSKEAHAKGFNLKFMGQALIKLFKSELSIIEKMQVTFITDEKEVEEFVENAKKTYEARDERARTLSEEDVDEFYACLMCQSFAPSHVCIITPERTSLCGAISWLEGRAATRADPKGTNFSVQKGEVLDVIKGEYTGVNEVVAETSGGETERCYLHSMFGYPHTSCGCFESLAFYIPEVDGIGVVHREHPGDTPIGVPFSGLAAQTGGGRQGEGIMGMAIEYMRSRKFLQADGGWDRIVWLPKSVKEMVEDAIPEELREKIATEDDAIDIDPLKAFLEKKVHPVVQRWEFEVTEELKNKLMGHIEKQDGEIYPEEAAKELGISEDQVMNVIEGLQEDGILE